MFYINEVLFLRSYESLIFIMFRNFKFFGNFEYGLYGIDM